MGRLVHTGLGSSSLVAHVLLYPPPPREQLCNRSVVINNSWSNSGIHLRHLTNGTLFSVVLCILWPSWSKLCLHKGFPMMYYNLTNFWFETRLFWDEPEQKTRLHHTVATICFGPVPCDSRFGTSCAHMVANPTTAVRPQPCQRTRAQKPSATDRATVMKRQLYQCMGCRERVLFIGT